ncbi:unnamed protein product [Adineta steineri]|uniref:Iodothyronine deiodinase n=2 Tax=Adineta steineri TaxID=433720 RepID=A0A814NLD1_9BILA|nr:unnamed protein product [Adineta steineri]
MHGMDVVNKPPDIGNDQSSSTLLSTVQRELSDDLPSLETVRQMIKYETSLRLSESVQQLLDLYHKDDNAITVILDSIQQHVVEHFGYSHVNILRSALSRFPDDPVIKEAFYIKHNKITQGLVNQGESAVERINKLFRSHASAMQLLTIYIAEAHARDQWPAGKTISCVDQPTILEQRLDNARQFKDKYNFEMPMLVDSMNNTFHTTYGSWPFRFYVINNGKLVFKAEPGETTYSYDMDELDAWIASFYQEKNI